MLNEQKKEVDQELDKEEEVDADLATQLGISAINDPSLEEGLIGMVQSADPSMVAGQFLGQLITQIKTNLDDNNAHLSDRVWMADGGVVDRLASMLSERIASETGIAVAPDDIYADTAEYFKFLVHAGQANQQAQQGAPAPGVPAGPFAQQASQQPVGGGMF